jgi:glutathione S-transferase
MTEFVDLDTAKSKRGVRLVTVGGVPSPWSEAAKGIFHAKKIPFVAVRMLPGDKTVKEWTRARNAPVVMHDDDPGRTGWAEILELAELIAPEPPLVPRGDRVRLFGIAHEIMGESGLLWSSRLLTLDASFSTDGNKGFPSPIAQYLAPRYGFAKERVDRARRRATEVLSLLGETLGGRSYYFGDTLSALDIYSATAMNLFSLPPNDRCPMMDMIRASFESMRGELDIPPALITHRDRIYERHLELPIAL